MNKNEKQTNLLWTGGWDSTFRLADLLIIKKQIVQPIYIIDEDRASKDMELKVMDEIREFFHKQFPGTKGLFLTTAIYYKKKIKENSEVTKMYSNLVKKYHLGTQYDWLARFAEQYNYKNLEISIVKDGTIHKLLRENLIEKKDDIGSFYILQEEPKNKDLRLFINFKFPILYYTKTDMYKVAIKYNFTSIMEHTWFCHHPTKKGTPCGWCAPCRIAKKQGMGRRVPFSIKGILKGAILEARKKLKI